MAGAAKAAVLRKERRWVADGFMESDGVGLLKFGDVAGVPCGHGEAAFGAEGDAGGLAGGFQEAERFAIQGGDADAVFRADTELALRGHGEAVEAFFGEGGEDFARPQRAVRVDREAEDIRRAAVGDEEMLLVGREGDAVRLVEALGGFRERFGLRIKAEHELAGQLFFVIGALAEEPVRIGDPKRAVGLYDDVVGAVELFALKGIREHFHTLSLGVPAGELPRGLLDNVKAARAIGPKTRRLGRVLAPDDETGGLGPFEGEAVMMRSVLQRVADPLCPLAARMAGADGSPTGVRRENADKVAFHQWFTGRSE